MRSFADIKRADSHGAVYLVGRQAHHGQICCFHINRLTGERLYGVTVKGDILPFAYPANRFDILLDAGFIIGRHDGNQNGVITKGVNQPVEIDQASAVHVKEGDIDALGPGQVIKRLAYGIMFRSY